jgi:peptide-methionine (S)-S-oxide reductase
MEQATFAAGCFWGVEATFRKVPGVLDTKVGYTGGHTRHPSYEQVCQGNTGHAEAVQVTFDPRLVSYEDLLTVFWRCHDPTTPNRQGPDTGHQYRSAIFYHSPAQRQAALESKRQITARQRYPAPIVTEITALGPFYPAEDYHQRYLERRN